MKPLHPLLRAMVDEAAAWPLMHQAPLAKVRASASRRLATGLPKEAVASVEDIVAVDADRSIRLRAYRPDMRTDRPLTVFFHGGGFTICSLDTHDGMCRQICRRAGSVVVSVDYRLAPEHPYPAGLDDCYAATLWAAANANRLGANGSRLAVCGDSAGGALAAAVALRARTESRPGIRAQILLYPVTDHYSADRPSYTERGGRDCGLTADEMRWFWDLYLPDQSLSHEPIVSPARAPSFVGLPRAYVVTAEYDLLRDEGEAYARSLAEAGVPVVLKRYETMNHGFLNWVGVVEPASEAMDQLAAWMRASL
jgi:acetyl esterase